MIQAVFFDIDGTLLPFGMQKFTDSTRVALWALKKKGIKVFISSGRPPVQLPLLGEEFNAFPFDGYITLNGQYCLDSSHQVFHDMPIPKEALVNLIPWIKNQDFSCTFMELNYSYDHKFNQSFHDYVVSIGKPEMDLPIEDPIRALTHDTYQICPYVKEDIDAEFLKHAPGLKSARWSDDFADMIPEKGGKPVGIQAALSYYGLDQSQSISFGDGANDITMLQFTKIGIAMGNAKESVKKAADYVTNDCDQDGIYNALKHFEVI